MKDLISIDEYREKVKCLAKNPPKQSKYRNKIIHAHDKKFDSKKEYNRYLYLTERMRRGEIYNLQTQVRFILHSKDKIICSYIADFCYDEKIPGAYNSSKQVVEDVKSEITQKNPVYRIKKKMMFAEYNIEIQEV